MNEILTNAKENNVKESVMESVYGVKKSSNSFVRILFTYESQMKKIIDNEFVIEHFRSYLDSQFNIIF